MEWESVASGSVPTESAPFPRDPCQMQLVSSSSSPESKTPNLICSNSEATAGENAIPGQNCACPVPARRQLLGLLGKLQKLQIEGKSVTAAVTLERRRHCQYVRIALQNALGFLRHVLPGQTTRPMEEERGPPVGF